MSKFMSENMIEICPMQPAQTEDEGEEVIQLDEESKEEEEDDEEDAGF